MLGRFLTAARDPQAKLETENRATKRPTPNSMFLTSDPIETMPPSKTKTKPIKKKGLSLRLSKNISKKTAAKGIIAAANAATTGEVRLWAITRRREPMPKPVAPIKQPSFQFAQNIRWYPSEPTHMENIKKKARMFRIVAIETTPQVSRSISKIGNPNAKSIIAIMHTKFEKKFDVGC